jgi:predicted esterase
MSKMASVAHQMSLPHTATLALQAPFELPLDLGHCWYPLLDDAYNFIEPNISNKTRMRGLQRSLKALCSLILNVMSAGMRRSRIFLMGYVQGGITATNLALQWHSLVRQTSSMYDDPDSRFAGVITMGSCLLEEQLLQCQQQQNQLLHSQDSDSDSNSHVCPESMTTTIRDESTPLFVTHGSRYQGVPLSMARKQADMLGKWLQHVNDIDSHSHSHSHCDQDIAHDSESESDAMSTKSQDRISLTVKVYNKASIAVSSAGEARDLFEFISSHMNVESEADSDVSLSQHPDIIPITPDMRLSVEPIIANTDTE